MLKQSLIYLVISILAVLLARYLHVIVVYLDICYTYISLTLTPLFSSSDGGILLRSVIILTLLPILITAIPALIYRLFKGGLMPYYFEATWMLWLLIVVSKIIIL